MQSDLDKINAEIIFRGQLEEMKFDDAMLEARSDENFDWMVTTFDNYDTSFEFKQCTPGMTLNEKQRKIMLEAGFSRAWLCHTDNTETYYYREGDEIKEHKKGAVKRNMTPTDNTLSLLDGFAQGFLVKAKNDPLSTEKYKGVNWGDLSVHEVSHVRPREGSPYYMIRIEEADCRQLEADLFNRIKDELGLEVEVRTEW